MERINDSLGRYYDFIKDISERVMNRIGKQKYETFYTRWVIDASVHNARIPEQYDKCDWIMPVYVAFDMVVGKFIDSTPKIEYDDKLIITFDINSVDKFTVSKIREILTQEMAHVHIDYAYTDDDLKILRKLHRSDPKINVQDNYKDLFSRKMIVRTEYDGVNINAYNDLLFLSSDDEEEK